MKENRTVVFGIISTVVLLVALTGIFILYSQQPAPQSIPFEAIPLENVQENNRVYEIVSAESEVRFRLDEMLRGVQTEVVGVTDQVVGQIAFDVADLTAVQVGTISIKASTLATDNNFRNNTLRNDILQSVFYETIAFTPSHISELSGSIALGETAVFTITGDLTIRDVTQPVTFAVSAQALTPERLEGSATATITRADYQLDIPSVSGVADVADEIKLEFDFVAEAIP